MNYNNLNVKLKPSKIKIKIKIKDRIKNSFHVIKSQANTHLIPKNK